MGASIESIRTLEELIKAVKGKEMGPLEAFLQVKQMIQPDESVARLKKRFQLLHKTNWHDLYQPASEVKVHLPF